MALFPLILSLPCSIFAPRLKLISLRGICLPKLTQGQAKQLRRRNDGIGCRGVSPEHCPETPRGLGVQACPETHTARQGKLSSLAQVFLKGADGYCACDCDVIDNANDICFARSTRKGEKECITERNNRTFRRNWPTT